MTLHKGLLREAPGSDESTLRALMATGLGGALRAADMGCGPGAASLMMARAFPGAEILSIDTHAPYLETLVSRAHAAGLRGIEPREADMADPGIAPGSLDLILCEGALYFLGVQAGLRLWRPLLKAGGVIAFSEAVWRSDVPPEAARLFWMEYPEMTDMAGTEARVAKAGFEVMDRFVLPDEDWRAYLGPLGARAEALRPEADETMRQVLDGAEEEAALFERHGSSYGYAYFIVRPVP